MCAFAGICKHTMRNLAVSCFCTLHGVEYNIYCYYTFGVSSFVAASTRMQVGLCIHRKDHDNHLIHCARNLKTLPIGRASDVKIGQQNSPNLIL